jgi:hypothetical protein
MNYKGNILPLHGFDHEHVFIETIRSIPTDDLVIFYHELEEA